MLIENEYRVIGPAGCLTGDTIVKTNRAKLTRKFRLDYIVERIETAVPGGLWKGGGYARQPVTKWDSNFTTYVRSNVDGLILLQPIVAVIRSGVREVFRLSDDEGRSIKATADHRFLTPEGYVELRDLSVGGGVGISADPVKKVFKIKKNSYSTVEGLKFHPLAGRRNEKRFTVCRHRVVFEAALNEVGFDEWVRRHRKGLLAGDERYLKRECVIHHMDENHKNNELSNLAYYKNHAEHSRSHGLGGRWKDIICKLDWSTISSIERVGEEETYDLTVGHPSGEGNFEANGLMVHNCGKTRYLSDQVAKRVERWCEQTGQSSMHCTDVLLASLTRTAAAELKTRGLNIQQSQVGTLHSHALHALGKPKLCVSGKAIGQWNKESPMEYWRSEGAASQSEDGVQISLGRYMGDALFSEYTTNRCRLTPREEWRTPVVEFAKLYESWKYRNDYMDYDDLIIKAFEDGTSPPGNPSTILGDEQQDSSRAEFQLMRHWGTKVDKLIMCGDPAQAIYSFRGGDPEGMYRSEIPPENSKILEQSYRVPRAVHAEAMRTIRRADSYREAVYYPRPEDGEVERVYWSMKNSPFAAVERIEQLLKEPDERPGTPKVMCLFSCAYQANPLMAALRSVGIPYWNPYATERSNFNPLHPSKGISTLDRVLDFLRNSESAHGDKAAVWTWEQFYNWTDICAADGWLRHGSKTEIKRRASLSPQAVMTVDDITALISHEDVMADLVECKLEWLGEHLLEARKGIYRYLVDILQNRGYNGLVGEAKTPRVCVGTGHSCKGAESENVIICPDLSSSGWETFGDYYQRDAIFRLYYVMLTRARHRLILTSPSCSQAIDL